MDISQTIHLLGDLLGEVISDLESPALFATEERIRAAAKARRASDQTAAAALSDEIARLSPDEARAVASAFALYFDLVNLAEENERVDALRQREASLPPNQPMPDSIREAVGLLKSQGVSAEEMSALLSQLSIELVLTAHPTEAKRRTLLSKLQRIARVLRQLGDNNLLPRETAALRESIRAEMVSIWLTDRARTARMEVTDEVRTGLYHVDEFFWDMLPRLYADLDAALREHYPGLAAPPAWLRLGSWIGGDRDGNPNVTAAVTAETLRLHRGLAVEKHRAALQEVGRRLSLSSRRVPPPP
ncbi:MAG: phosphoenolpyruvate carboxylase, partial [Anaerolineales bacterium]